MIELENIVVKNLDELIRSAEIFGNLLGSAGSMYSGSIVTVVDPEYRIHYVNQKAIEVFGDIKKGQKCYEAYRRGSRVCKGCPTEDVLGKGKSIGGFKVHNKRVDLYLEVNSYLVLDGSGKKIAVVEVAQDINNMLLAADKAHQANNLLSPITSLNELLDPTVKKNWRLNLAQQSAEKIGSLMSDLQSILLKKSKADDYTRDQVDVKHILEGVVEFFKPQYEHEGVKLKTDFEEVPVIAGHRKGLEGVFMNIFSNSIHACRNAPKPEVRLKLCHRDGYIVFESQDNGYGIKPEIIDFLFDPGFTTKPDGHGLGLSTAKKIIEKRHFGKIIAESEGKNKGAKFTITLPDAQTLKKMRKRKQNHTS